MRQHLLNDVLLMFIELELTFSVDIDNIIDEFEALENRRVNL
jgi:hypothetical protein